VKVTASGERQSAIELFRVGDTCYNTGTMWIWSIGDSVKQQKSVITLGKVEGDYESGNIPPKAEGLATMHIYHNTFI